MQKNNYNPIQKSLAVVFLSVLMFSCNDFLDVTPPSSIAPENYLQEESHLAAYTIRYYGIFPSHSEGSNSFYYNDLSTDNATSRTTSSRYVPGKWTVGATGGVWKFENIYALNYYLQTVLPRFKAGKINGNATNIAHYVGEGYFLRAYEYFYRLRKLGDFPIITEVLADNQEQLTEASKRAPRNEVARFIIEDLDEAIKLLTDAPPGGKTRITRNTALLLKARVALFEATWLKYHAGTPLVPNGPDWPGATKEYNKGYAFPEGSLQGEIEFFLTEAMEASQEVADAISLVPNNATIQESADQPTNAYYDMFATPAPSGYEEVLMYREHSKDLGIAHNYNHYLYHGAQKGYTHQMEQTFLMQNGLPVYNAGSGYQGDDYIQDTKIDRDYRWRLFMKAPGEIKAFKNIDVPERFEDAPVIYSADNKYSTSTGYILGKGYSLDYNMQILSEDMTAPIIFRAAEAYLIYLEACYEKTGAIDSKAASYWKALRSRAGVNTDYNQTITATDMSQEALYDWGAYSKDALIDATLYNIRRERRCELIGEGYRYDDLIRWRAMDQLNGFQIEGCKVWGPMQNDYPNGVLLADQANEKDNTISSPSLSAYLRPYQVVQANNDFYGGLHFTEAHYLSPIAVQHFLITASNASSISTSPIYQNPGWGTVAGQGAKE